MQLDQALWSRIGNGDQEAYSEVYRFYYRRFYNYGRKFTDDESLIEDAVQEALLMVWDKRHTLASVDYPGTYFYTSFRYLLFGKLRQRKEVAADGASEGEPDFSIDQILISRETDTAIKEQLHKALTTLTARQREAIFLRFYEGLSYEEVAAVLGITTKATYKIMARALQQLKESVVLPSVFLLLLFEGLFLGRSLS